MSKGKETPRDKGQAKVPAAERAARQAEALRANLQRRKAQTRARREETPDKGQGEP